MLHVSWWPRGRGGDDAPGSLVRPVAGPVHEDLVAGVDEPVEQGLGDDRVGEQRIPVGGRPVGGQDQRAAGPLGDQLIQVVSLGGGQLAHAEVVQDEHGGAGELAEPLVPGQVGAAAGQVGQDPAGLGEPGLGAVPDGQVPQGLRDMGLADADRAVEDDRFPGVQPAQRGQVADLRGGQLRGWR